MSEQEYPYSAIVPMPYSSMEVEEGVPGRDDGFGLTIESEFSTHAALLMFRAKMASRIVIAGEQSFQKDHKKNRIPGSTDSNTAYLMKQYLIARGVPEQAIDCLAPHNNSFEQLKMAQALCETYDKKKWAAILAFEFHMPRVKTILKHYGFRADPYYIDRFIRRDDDCGPLYERWLDLWVVRKFIPVEWCIAKATWLAPWLIIPLLNWMSRRNGPRPPIAGLPSFY